MKYKQKFLFKKLVRDNVINFFNKENVEFSYKKLKKQERIKQLKTKLIEEAKEVLETLSHQECIEEIADVLDVIEALKKLLNISDREILEKSNVKNKSRGGFEKGYFIEFINIDKTHPLTKYFEKNSKRYPKI